MRPDAGLATPFLGPRDVTRGTRDRIEALSQEVSTGRSSDVGRAVRGDFSEVSRHAADLHRRDAIAIGLKRAQSWSGAAQSALGGIASVLDALSEAIPLGLDISQGFASEQGAAAARDVARLLNSAEGGRFLFAGGRTEPPLPDVDAVLADVSALAALSTDYGDYTARIEAYFAPGGGLETNRLADTAPDLVRFSLAGGDTVDVMVSARTRELIGALEQAALVAGLSDLSFEIDDASPEAGDLRARIEGARRAMPALRGTLGAVEARIETRAEENDAARDAAEMALADRIGIDPFEAAAGLRNEMARLETLYAVTARRAALRLTDWLR
jgi:flagellar hook-associated protein 3 FlgL